MGFLCRFGFTYHFKRIDWKPGPCRSGFTALSPKQNYRSSVRTDLNLMDDLAHRIAAGEIFPSFAFSFKALDPTVLIYHLAAPECEICAIG
jgi:hypothetical protein